MSHRISLRSLYKLFIWLPHSTAEKISEGCLISTISTCIGKHHCCKCFSEVACHEDGAVKTIDWLLDAAELFGKGAAACCYLPAFAMLPASYAWFIHSPLAFRPASDKSSSLSSRNLSAMLWPSLLICPGHPNKNEATLCLSHMREIFWERNFKVATGHTQRIATCSCELFVWLSEL